jgi:transposase-like protein
MSSETREDPPTTTTPRFDSVRISCPGCGRHDYVRWPLDQPVYHWKCFNCTKEFDLTREEGH